MTAAHGIERARTWLGRRLLRTETRLIVNHYRKAAEQAWRGGDDAGAERCAHIVIGATYVAERWPHARR